MARKRISLIAFCWSSNDIKDAALKTTKRALKKQRTDNNNSNPSINTRMMFNHKYYD